MTDAPDKSGFSVTSGQVCVKVGGPIDAQRYTDEIVRLYEREFFDPSFPSQYVDVYKKNFPKKLEQNIAELNFKIVTAWLDGDLAGFVYGRSLTADTSYWDDLVKPLTSEFTREDGQRTLALPLLLVKKSLRGKRYGSALHSQLLQGRREERVVLVSEPATQPAYSIWQHWGYRKVATIKPPLGESTRDILVRPISRTPRPATGC